MFAYLNKCKLYGNAFLLKEQCFKDHITLYKHDKINSDKNNNKYTYITLVYHFIVIHWASVQLTIFSLVSLTYDEMRSCKKKKFSASTATKMWSWNSVTREHSTLGFSSAKWETLIVPAFIGNTFSLCSRKFSIVSFIYQI